MGENLFHLRHKGFLVAVRQGVCRYFFSSFLFAWFQCFLHRKRKCTYDSKKIYMDFHVQISNVLFSKYLYLKL